MDKSFFSPIKKIPPRKESIALILTVAFSILLLPNCSKIESSFTTPVSEVVDAETTSFKSTIDKFFDTTGSDELVKKVAEILLRQEEKEPFVEKFIHYGGYPIWQKALVKTSPKADIVYMRGEGDENANELNDIVYVPFALENDSVLNAVLTVNMYERDTTLQMQYYWQYNAQGYGKMESRNNAEQTALFFMGYESYIFGHKDFVILDHQLLPSMESDTVSIVSFNLPNIGEKVAAEGTVTCVADESYNTVCTIYSTLVISDLQDVFSDDSKAPIIDLGIGGGGAPAAGNLAWNNNPCGNQSTPSRVMPCGDGIAGYKILEEVVVTALEKEQIEEQLLMLIEDAPFLLVDSVPCAQLKDWIATINHEVSQSGINKLNQIVTTITSGSAFTPKITTDLIAHIQKINDAYSAIVNMDFFPVTITKLPIVNGYQLNPEEFLGYIRLNINSFIDTKFAEFIPYNYYGIDDNGLWNSANPLNAVIAINISGPDNGSVIVSESKPDKWTFTTIFEPNYKSHPVSGNRDFGFKKADNGSYTFYTRGVDRLTSWDASFLNEMTKSNEGRGYPLKQADKLWESFQSKVSEFVNNHNGSSYIDKQNTIKKNPDWKKLLKILNGQLPLETLSPGCPN